MAIDHQSIPRKNISHLKNLFRGALFFRHLNIYHWAALALSALCISATILLSLSLPIALRMAIDTLENHVPEQSIVWPLFLLSLYAGAWLIRQVTVQLREICAIAPFEHIIVIIARKVFGHLLTLPMDFHTQRQLNSMTGLFKKAQLNIHIIYIVLLYWVIPLTIESLGAVFIVFKLFGPFFASVLAITLICYCLSINYFSEITKRYRQHFLDVLSKSHFTFIDTFLHAETVKAFCREAFEFKRFKDINSKTAQAQEKYGTVHTSMHLVEAIILGLGITCFCMKAASLISSKTFSISDFIMLHGYVLQFALPLSVLGHLLRYLQTGLVDLGSIFDVLDTAPSIKNLPDAQKLICPRGEITFSNVSFGYDDQRTILKNFSCTIPPRSTVGIVGSSGGGKSTLIRLLSRQYEPQSGSISIDGQNIQNVTLQSLRQRIATVPQECTLFNASIFFNIAYANPSASAEEIFNAARAAELEGFIKTLPHQYETIIGERGLKLSGGERQRVAIARALLKNSPIYVFDEATSALDNTTEQKVQKNLKAWCTHASTLIIAHRLSTIVHADTILFLEDGSVAEHGSHEQLLERKGKYAALWNQQQKAPNQDDSV